MFNCLRNLRKKATKRNTSLRVKPFCTKRFVKFQYPNNNTEIEKETHQELRIYCIDKKAVNRVTSTQVMLNLLKDTERTFVNLASKQNTFTIQLHLQFGPVLQLLEYGTSYSGETSSCELL